MPSTLVAATDSAIPSVCIDCRYIGKRPSGIAEFVRGLIDHAPDLAPEIEFHLLKNPEAPGQLSAAANVVEHEVGAGTNSPLSLWFLPEIAPAAGCDVFHATANTLPARLAMKTVVSVHDVMWLDRPDWCDQGALRPIKQAFFSHGIRRTLASADTIAAISDATKTALLARDPALAERIEVTLPGVHERFAPRPRDDAMLERLGVPRGADFALVVGQHAPYKNHDGAMRAFAFARESLGDAKLVFVQRQGPGPEQLQSLAHKLGVAEHVIFTGPIADEGLIQLYSSARTLLHPSFCEGFGNPVAEAMSCGCPVITSNVSAMPEVAGNAALLIDPNDPEHIAKALTSIWNDADQRAALRNAGLQRASELSWGEFARANVEIYRSLIASS